MTPAEQEAQRLIEWFFNIIQPSTTNTHNPILVREQAIKAKQCAIKVCEDIQKSMDEVMPHPPFQEFYEQVKTAINNYEQ